MISHEIKVKLLFQDRNEKVVKDPYLLQQWSSFFNVNIVVRDAARVVGVPRFLFLSLVRSES